MIPVQWTVFTCTVPGSTVKVVECEQCKNVYVYQMTREVSRKGRSPYGLDDQGAQQRAHAAAQEDLNQLLAEDCDPIPCMQCGHYQSHMVDKVQRDQSAGFAFIPFALIVLSFALFGLAAYFNTQREMRGYSLYFNIGGGVVGFLVFVAFVVQGLAFRFNPNAKSAEERMARGRELSMTLDEYEKQVGAKGK